MMATQPALAAGAPPTVTVEQSVELAGKYSVFNLQVSDPVSVSVGVAFSSPSTEQFNITLQTFMVPTDAAGSAQTPNGTQALRFTYRAPARVIEPWTFIFTVPAGSTVSNITVTGNYVGSSILWKDQVQVAPSQVFGTYQGQPVSPQYTLVVSHTSSLEVKKVDAPGLVYYTYPTAGGESIVSTGSYPGYIVFLFQPSAWDPVAWAILIAAVVLLLLLPNRRFRARVPKVSGATDVFVKPLRRLWRLISGLDSHKFLAIYIIISVLMLSMSFMAGPDPRYKVFVIASDHTTKEIAGNLTSSLGNVQILTPSDTVSEFNTMATLGTVQMVVISDYNKLDIASIDKYIVKSLDLVPLTVVVQDPAPNPNIAGYAERLYNQSSLGLGNALISVSSPSQLSSNQIRGDVIRVARANPLGIGLSVRTFEAVAGTVGLLSFLLITFGIAFLFSKLLELGDKPLAHSLAAGVFYSGAVFFFTQAIYMSSSALLGWPLALHAVTSGSGQVTVLGLFHFGAGNQPRTLAAVVGLVIAAVPPLWGKVDRYVAAAIAALFFFLVVDPLTGGTVFFEFALLLTGGPQLGFANNALLSVKSFLNQIGSDAAGWVSGNFGISSGEMFYYFGAVPFSLIPRLQKSTGTFALFLCGFAAADGIVRVGEMTAYKTAPSMVAGALAGLLLAISLVGLSRIEAFVRRYFPSGR